MKNRFFLCCLLGIIFVSLLSSCAVADRQPLDISNLEIENISDVLQEIRFEDAVSLNSKLTSTIDRVSEE